MIENLLKNYFEWKPDYSFLLFIYEMFLNLKKLLLYQKTFLCYLGFCSYIELLCFSLLINFWFLYWTMHICPFLYWNAVFCGILTIVDGWKQSQFYVYDSKTRFPFQFLLSINYFFIIHRYSYNKATLLKHNYTRICINSWNWNKYTGSVLFFMDKEVHFLKMGFRAQQAWIKNQF